MYCAKCGKELSLNSQICGNCGESFAVLSNNNQGSEPGQIFVAPQSKRIINYFLDIVFVYIFAVIVGGLITLLGQGDFVQNANEDLSGLVILLVYFIFFESIFQKTPAKFITKTKVVKMNGDKPSFLNIIGRSFARFIPFDNFSFLSGKYPVGWHDRFSKTIIVSDKLTKEEINKIVPNKEKNSSVLMIIIIFFAAIVMIGLIASLSIAALSNARERARDAERMADLGQMRIALEMYFNDNASYPDNLNLLKEYLYIIPVNPKSTKGLCAGDFDYKYTVLDNNKSYKIDYCLSSDTASGIKAGYNTASPDSNNSTQVPALSPGFERTVN